MAAFAAWSSGSPVMPRRPDEGNAVKGNPLLFNARTYDPAHFDTETRRLLGATIDFFENRGKKALIDSYIDRAWYGDFLQFAAKEGQRWAATCHGLSDQRQRRIA